MGKRKAAKKQTGPKKKDPLPSTFACLFCNHESSVTVKMEKKSGIGSLSCRICGQHFQTGINYLSGAVDVYSDWIDACDSVAKEVAGHASTNAVSRTRRDSLDEDLDDDFIEMDDVEREGAYAD